MKERLVYCRCGCSATQKNHAELCGTHFTWECWNKLTLKQKLEFEAKKKNINKI